VSDQSVGRASRRVRVDRRAGSRQMSDRRLGKPFWSKSRAGGLVVPPPVRSVDGS